MMFGKAEEVSSAFLFLGYWYDSSMNKEAIENIAKQAKDSSKSLMGLSHEDRKSALRNIANNIRSNSDYIKSANEKDVDAARHSGLSPALIDRLVLDDDRIEAMAKGVEEIADQEEVVGKIISEHTNEAGLLIQRQRVPLGVILMIFESRPNVVIDCAALALKSSNAIILKGGKEAKYSNEILGRIVQESIRKYIPETTVQVLASDDRTAVQTLLSAKDYIDVVIPRGGERLIHYVYDNAKMPVIAHFLGLCHMYIDKDANKDWILPLVLNAKTQRTGVCNAIETLIVHEDILPSIEKELVSALKEKGCELRVDERFMELATDQDLRGASQADWETEYLDNILSIKTVSSLQEAIDHIQIYGSFHTECIISDNEIACEKFRKEVDASCIMVNASTRFNDGGQLGLGAELGISTTKLHAYGPMGAEEMTTLRFVVTGKGNIRA